MNYLSVVLVQIFSIKFLIKFFYIKLFASWYPCIRVSIGLASGIAYTSVNYDSSIIKFFGKSYFIVEMHNESKMAHSVLNDMRIELIVN